MKLSHFDRTLIHGLGQLSRPPLIDDPRDHALLADIVGVSAERASSAPEIARLVAVADRVGATPDAHRGTVHEVAIALNAFDRLAMAAHWSAARGQS